MDGRIFEVIKTVTQEPARLQLFEVERKQLWVKIEKKRRNQKEPAILKRHKVQMTGVSKLKFSYCN